MKKLSKEHYLTLAIFCAHYHSGQWSRGYRLLSKLNARWSSSVESEVQESEEYQWLVDNYGNKM